LASTLDEGKNFVILRNSTAFVIGSVIGSQ